ncbi:MAG: polysaccharide deacetylase family protein [Clostridia bacterium]|nr:polysaccharide deacetylase family protein [Clostridia bacterium]
MKRVVSIILLALMLIMSASCNNTPASTDTSADTNSTSGGGSTDTNKPSINYTEDKNVYKAETSEDGTQITYLKETLDAPFLAPWFNNYKSAISFTFDDGYHAQTGPNVNEIFAKYNFRGTMMLGPCFIQDQSLIDSWNESLKAGYLDVGCHAYNHKEPTTLDPSEYEHEIKDAVEFLREKFPTQNVLTFATPFAHINDPYQDFLDDFVITNRLEAGGDLIVPGKGQDLYRVKAYSLNTRVNVGALQPNIEQAVKNGQWIVELCHCVTEEASGVDVELSVFEAHCKWLYDNYGDDVWFGSFEDVSIYLRQHENTKINYVAADKESMTFTLSCDLDKDIYNYPMSFTAILPKYADSAYAIIDGVEQDLTIKKLDEYTKSVTVVNAPTDGTEVKIVFGGNKNYKNGCAYHIYQKDITYQPTCTERGYTEMVCIYCNYMYKSQYKPAGHTYETTNLTREEQREDGKYLITYRICADCGQERMLKEEIIND